MDKKKEINIMKNINELDLGVMIPVNKSKHKKDAEDLENEKIRQMSDKKRLKYLETRSKESKKKSNRFRKRLLLGLGAAAALSGGIAYKYGDKIKKYRNDYVQKQRNEFYKNHKQRSS